MIKRIKADDYKDEIISMFESGKSCIKIKKYFDNLNLQISEGAISKFLKNKGYKVGNDRFRLSEKEIDNVILMYKNGKSLKEICTKYNRTYNRYISKILKDNNIEINARTRNTSRASKINEEYFNEINTQNKAYFLGLIIADGCIANYRKSFALSLDLKSSDEYILKKFSDEINGNNKILKNRGCSSVRYGSKKLCTILFKYGVVPRKSKITTFPKIQKEFNRHIIRGIFDGDGTVYIRKDTSKKHDIRLEFGFAGTKELLTSIKKILIQDISISNNKIVVREDRNISQLMFSKLDDIKNFYNYIYKDSEIYLKRKKEKFDKFLNLYDNTEIAISDSDCNA